MVLPLRSPVDMHLWPQTLPSLLTPRQPREGSAVSSFPGQELRCREVQGLAGGSTAGKPRRVAEPGLGALPHPHTRLALGLPGLQGPCGSRSALGLAGLQGPRGFRSAPGTKSDRKTYHERQKKKKQPLLEGFIQKGQHISVPPSPLARRPLQNKSNKVSS